MATDRLFAQPEAWTKMDHEIALQWISINERSAQLPYDVAIQLLGSHHLEHLDEFEMDPIVTQNILEITQAATIKHIQGRNGIRKSYIKLHEVLRFKDWRSTFIPLLLNSETMKSPISNIGIRSSQCFGLSVLIIIGRSHSMKTS